MLGSHQPQGTKNARSAPPAGVGKPPRPVPVPQLDEPTQQKAKVPVLEKHLLDQLSTEEQDSLNKKLEEAKDAEKKVILALFLCQLQPFLFLFQLSLLKCNFGHIFVPKLY